MPQLPFEIPKSLSTYAQHFDSDPIKAINRLEKQLKKRGPDAVGHFLLAWLYHLKGMDDQAVAEALKARIYAPGSPFFQKLHYYLSHPKAFEAWTPDQPSHSQQKTTSTKEQPGPVLDLDSLIQQLSAVESKRIRPKDNQEDESELKKEILTDSVDNIVSETLASIHEKQGKIEAAIRTYEQLKKLNREKRDHYSEQITRLQKIKEEQDEDEEE